MKKLSRGEREAEVWRDIPGYEGLYQVSDMGRVWKCERVIYARNRWGDIAPFRRSARLLKQSNVLGYPVVGLFKDGKSKQVKVHVVVMLVFVGPRPDGHQIHHISGNKQDNRRRNLIYLPGDYHNSISHKGLIAGAKNPRAKLDIVKVEDIRRRLVVGERMSDIANRYGVSKDTIGDIKRGKTWLSTTAGGLT